MKETFVQPVVARSQRRRSNPAPKAEGQFVNRLSRYDSFQAQNKIIENRPHANGLDRRAAMRLATTCRIGSR